MSKIEQHRHRSSTILKPRNPALFSRDFNPGPTESSGGRIKDAKFGETITLAKRLFAVAILTGALVFIGPTSLRASERECQHRLAKADHQLHRAAREHGWDSRQAEHARHELREAREYCWTHEHKWWDEDDRRWHSDRDWDDHDHDHDRDRDHDHR